MKINELKNHFDEEIEIQGFVESVRNIKWVQFIVIRDLTGKVQVTIEKSVEENAEMVELVNNLTQESTVKIKGKITMQPCNFNLGHLSQRNENQSLQ